VQEKIASGQLTRSKGRSNTFPAKKEKAIPMRMAFQLLFHKWIHSLAGL
jgi:hypothetical protein